MRNAYVSDKMDLRNVSLFTQYTVNAEEGSSNKESLCNRNALRTFDKVGECCLVGKSQEQNDKAQ
jgi:hypothetical protein